MPPIVRRSRHWCFTSYAIGEGTTLARPCYGERYRFLCYQEECCPTTGRHHLQGYFILKKACRLSQVKTFDPCFETAHFEQSKGSPSENVAYCSKPESAIADSFCQYGICPGLDGDSSGLSSGRSHTRAAGIDALRSGASLNDIRDQHPGFFLQSFRAIERYISLRDAFDSRTWTLPSTLYPWQEEMLSLLSIPTVPPLEAPNDRRVTWVYDQLGGKGKSTLLKIVVSKYPTSSVIITSSSLKRVVEAMLPQQHVVMLDLPRDYDLTKFNYSAIETVKDGIGARTMYQPETKIWRNPHLIIFSNQLPERSKLTHDRWNVLDISPSIFNSSI